MFTMASLFEIEFKYRIFDKNFNKQDTDHRQ
jgi:hypothetical protein